MLVRSRTTDTPVVGPTPNVAVCISSEPRATYGDKGKAAGFHPLAGGFAANPQMTTRRFPPPIFPSSPTGVVTARLGLNRADHLRERPIYRRPQDHLRS
jgi:hypothetical protein